MLHKCLQQTYTWLSMAWADDECSVNLETWGSYGVTNLKMVLRADEMVHLVKGAWHQQCQSELESQDLHGERKKIAP